MVENVFIGLGSNLGDSVRILQKAWSRLGQNSDVSLISLSSPFLSAPVDMSSNQWFTNAAGQISTSLPADELLRVLLQVEQSLGRTRDKHQSGYQDRTIDLDLLYYNDQTYDTPRLTLPHPHLYNRLFVLAPLKEIASDFLDPVTHHTISRLYQRLLQKMESGDVAVQEISMGQWPEF